MSNEQFYDLQRLGQKINEYCRAMVNFRAVKESRGTIAKNLHIKYPNMEIDAIRNTIWEQEEYLAKVAQTEFDEMRMNAYSLGWNFDHKDVHDELTGILRKPITNLNDINV